MSTSIKVAALTKSYVDTKVDTTAQGLHVLTPVKAATTSTIEAVTYNNGTSGVGATITSNEAASISPLDGVTLTGGDRVLIKDQSSGAHHGIYTVTTVGSGSVNFVLTRDTDFDDNDKIRIGDFVFCEGGTVNAGHGFVMTGSSNFTSSGGSGTIGSHTITFTRFSGLTTPVALNQGGTGVAAEDAAAAANALGLGTVNNVQFNSLGVGTAASGTTGEIRATNDITAFYSSDKRLKTNIKPIQDPLTKLQKIGGYTFDWIPKQGIHSHTGNDIGVIAQEIEEVLPEVTTTRENGYKAVKYEKLTAYLIECVKAQQTHIHQLEDRLVKLEKKD